MDASANISAPVFAAYLKCSTKAYLTAHGEKAPDTFVADTLGQIWAAYKARVSQGYYPGMQSVSRSNYPSLQIIRIMDNLQG